jgi:hypothetical protein
VALGTTSNVLSSSNGTLDGTYLVHILTSDLVNNPTVSSNVNTQVVVRQYTQAPSWITPSSSRAIFSSTTLSWVYNLPTPATILTPKITFTPFSGTPTVLTMIYFPGDFGAQGRTFDILNPTGTNNVLSVSGPALVPAEYNITIQYQNDAGSPVNSSTLYGIIVGFSSFAVQVTGITSGSVYSSLAFNVTIPDLAANGQIIINFSNATYSKNFTIQNNNNLNYVIRFFNFTSNPPRFDILGGSYVSTSPSGVFYPGAYNNAYTVRVFMTDYAGRYQLSSTPITNVILAPPFCVYSFRQTCSDPFYGVCMQRCTMNAFTNQTDAVNTLLVTEPATNTEVLFTGVIQTNIMNGQISVTLDSTQLSDLTRSTCKWSPREVAGIMAVLVTLGVIVVVQSVLLSVLSHRLSSIIHHRHRHHHQDGL